MINILKEMAVELFQYKWQLSVWESSANPICTFVSKLLFLSNLTRL
jgi:hypothetical protein